MEETKKYQSGLIKGTGASMPNQKNAGADVCERKKYFFGKNKEFLDAQL